MGYRSEVAYQIVFKDRETTNKFIARIMMLGGYERKALEECQIEVLDNGREECFINFYASDVKWYDDYPEVKAHEALFNKAEERDSEGIEVDGAYCRIGEESDDNHERYFGNDPYEMVCISRQVIVDWM